MGRAVTKNQQGELEVDETFSFSGSNPTLDSVKLIAEDGGSVSKENPSWLSFTQSTSGSDLTATLQLDATGVSEYTTYTFEISATDDAGNEKSRRVNVGIGSLATDFQIENVMGQEDKYRSQNSQRVKNPATARVILETSMPASVDLEYVRNPSDEDNPSFTQSKSNVSQNETHHEFFFNVVLSSLYAFRVTAKADFDQSAQNKTSSVYFFTTGSTFIGPTSSNLKIDTNQIGLVIFSFDDVVAEIGGNFSSLFDSRQSLGFTSSGAGPGFESFNVIPVIEIQPSTTTNGRFSTPLNYS